MPHSDVSSPRSDVRLPLDLARVQRFLATAAPLINSSNLRAEQFSTGTSNPTYLLWSASNEQQRFVLRRKPAGKLIRGAHRIDREYQVQKALYGTGVPVAKMHAYVPESSGVVW